MLLSLSRCLSLIVLLIAGSAVAKADEKKLADAGSKWTGSVDDEKLMGKAPANSVITTEKAFEELNKSWKFVEDKVTVDFDKNLVLVATTRGSQLGGEPKLEDGDLKFFAFSTRDLRPGFRYLIIVYPKKGVETVNGKKLD